MLGFTCSQPILLDNVDACSHHTKELMSHEELAMDVEGALVLFDQICLRVIVCRVFLPY